MFGSGSYALRLRVCLYENVHILYNVEFVIGTSKNGSFPGVQKISLKLNLSLFVSARRAVIHRSTTARKKITFD